MVTAQKTGKNYMNSQEATRTAASTQFAQTAVGYHRKNLVHA